MVFSLYFLALYVFLCLSVAVLSLILDTQSSFLSPRRTILLFKYISPSHSLSHPEEITNPTSHQRCLQYFPQTNL